MKHSLSSKSWHHLQFENLYWVAPHCLPDEIQNPQFCGTWSQNKQSNHVAFLWPCQLHLEGPYISSTSEGLAHGLTPVLEPGQYSCLEYLSTVLHLRQCFKACPKHHFRHNFSSHCVVFPTTCSIPPLHQKRKHLTLFSWVLLHGSLALHTLPSPDNLRGALHTLPSPDNLRGALHMLPSSDNLPSALKTKTFWEFLCISIPTKTPTQTKC